MASSRQGAPALTPRPSLLPVFAGLAPLTIWMGVAFALPMGAVLLLALQEDTGIFASLSFVPSPARFEEILLDSYYLGVLWTSIRIGLLVTLFSVLIGLPVASWLARLPARWRALGVAIVLIPLLTNVVIRSVGLILLLSRNGPVDQATGLQILFTEAAVIIALVQVFSPFLIMALYDTLQARDPRIDEAASSLGASPVDRFLTVTLPLALPALRGGMVIVFLLASTAYVSATLLGGKKVRVVGMLVFEEGLLNQNYPLAAALAIVLLVTCLFVVFLINRAIDWATPWLRPGEGKRPQASAGLSLPLSVRLVLDLAGPWIGRALLAGGLFLLIFPLLMVVVNSVNNVPQATTAVWRGFTLRWYEAIFTQGSRYFDAAIISAQLAGAAILVAIAIALPAAFVLARRPSKGVFALNAFYMLPLALPGIALAIGMLKLLQIFVMVPPFLGLLLIHVVLIVPFTLAMLRATVLQLDVRLEEAAASLGANRVKTFLLIILPGLGPGLVAAGIIGFLISFGEVTVTAFLATARMQTLPVRIYGDVQFDVEPTVNAVSALLILGTIMMLLIVNRFMRLDRVWHR